MDIRDEFDNILSAFGKMSDLLHKRDELFRLHTQNNKLKKECGSCYNWMKTSQCPKEASGIKVSCGMPICDKFQMDVSTSNLIDKNNKEIKEILNQLQPNPSL